jgi:hypothetical protein
MAIRIAIQALVFWASAASNAGLDTPAFAPGKRKKRKSFAHSIYLSIFRENSMYEYIL